VLDGVLEIQGFDMNRIALVSAFTLLVAVGLKFMGVNSSLVGGLGLIAMIVLLISSFRSVWMPESEEVT
jgi:uncharacterized membrane protein